MKPSGGTDELPEWCYACSYYLGIYVYEFIYLCMYVGMYMHLVFLVCMCVCVYAFISVFVCVCVSGSVRVKWIERAFVSEQYIVRRYEHVCVKVCMH